MKRNNAYSQYISYALAGALCAAIIFGATLPLLALAWSPTDPIVPACNLTQITDGKISGLTNICTFCDFLLMVQNILNYMWWVITPAVLVIALIWGGALMFISSIQGDVAQGQKGKKIIFKTLIGIALVFASWLIIDTIIKILGGRIASTSVETSGGFGPWNKIKCVAPVVSTTPPPIAPPIEPPIATTTGSALICQAISRNGSISYGSGDCRALLDGSPIGARTTIQECADKKPPTVCQPGCTGRAVCNPKPEITVNPKMLAAIDSIGRTTPFQLSSITTGSHSSVSDHYLGNAVDVIPATRTTSSYEDILTKFKSADGDAWCETKTGKLYRSCLAVPGSEIISHIHVNF